jgi:hypothetical protein
MAWSLGHLEGVWKERQYHNHLLKDFTAYKSKSTDKNDGLLLLANLSIC